MHAVFFGTGAGFHYVYLAQLNEPIVAEQIGLRKAIEFNNVISLNRRKSCRYLRLVV
jgi:hypothetical protein